MKNYSFEKQSIYNFSEFIEKLKILLKTEIVKEK